MAVATRASCRAARPSQLRRRVPPVRWPAGPLGAWSWRPSPGSCSLFPLSRPATDLHRVHHGGLLRDRRPLAQRAARLRRPDLARPPGVRRHRRLRLGLHGHRSGQSFWVAVLAAAAIGGAQALVLGGVSLRVRGLYFALVTLSYGLVAEQNIFQIQELTGGGAGPAGAEARPGSTPSGATTTCASPSSPSCCYLDWRLMRSQGRALAPGPAREPAGGVDVRHQRAPGHPLRLRRVGRVRRPRRRADRPQRHVRVARRRGTSTWRSCSSS